VLTDLGHSDYTEGTASCPANMNWPLVIFDQVGTKTVNDNLADNYLCNNYP